MSLPKTQSRALELVVFDMDVTGKPTDQVIADAWGLADARSVREVRESEEYKYLLTELQAKAISHMGDKVMEIQNAAIDSLSELVPRMASAASKILTPPHGTPHPKTWRPKYPELTAATGAVNVLIRIAGLGSFDSNQPRIDSKASSQVLPTLQLAESNASIVREKYSFVVERIKESREDTVEADYEILQDSE